MRMQNFLGIGRTEEYSRGAGIAGLAVIDFGGLWTFIPE